VTPADSAASQVPPVAPATSSAEHDLRRDLRLRAVIFDWAGTVIDHGSFAPVVALVEAFRSNGIEITVEQARRPMGLFKRDHIRTILAEPEVADQWRRGHGGAPSTDHYVDLLYAAFAPIQDALIAKYAQLIDGVPELVTELRRRGYRIGSTTGYPRATAELAAAAARDQGYEPDAMVCADEVPAGRPEPWMLFRNLEALRVFPPAAAVKVGDTDVDIDEARNAGCWAIGVTRTGNALARTADEVREMDAAERTRLIADSARRLRERGAHAVVESVADLLPRLDDIERRLARGERP